MTPPWDCCTSDYWYEIDTCEGETAKIALHTPDHKIIIQHFTGYTTCLVVMQYLPRIKSPLPTSTPKIHL